jgi:hypothetical protein
MPCYFGDDDENPHPHCYRCDVCHQAICAGECADEISGPHGCRCVSDPAHLYFCLICQDRHAAAHGLPFGEVFPTCAGVVSSRGLDAAIESYLATETLTGEAPAVRAANLFLNVVSPGATALAAALEWVDDVEYEPDEAARARTGVPVLRLHASFFSGGTPVRLALLAAYQLGMAYNAGYRYSGVRAMLRNTGAHAFAGWAATGARPARAANEAWVEAILGPRETDEDQRRHRRTVQWLDSVFLEDLPDPSAFASWFVAEAVPIAG